MPSLRPRASNAVQSLLPLLAQMHWRLQDMCLPILKLFWPTPKLPQQRRKGQAKTSDEHESREDPTWREFRQSQKQISWRNTTNMIQAETGSREGWEDQVTYMMASPDIIVSETSSSISSKWSGESVFTTMISAMNSSVSSCGSGRGADGREGFLDARDVVLLRLDEEPGVRFFLFGA